MNFHEYCFIKARPVWEEGTEKVINRSIALSAKIAYTGEKVALIEKLYEMLKNGEKLSALISYCDDLGGKSIRV
jgi:hypothetical protein